MTLPSVWGMDREGSQSRSRTPGGGVAVSWSQGESGGSEDLFEMRILNHHPSTLK